MKEILPLFMISFFLTPVVIPHSGSTPPACPQNPGGNCTSTDALKAIQGVIPLLVTVFIIMGVILGVLVLVELFSGTERSMYSKSESPVQDQPASALREIWKIIRRLFYRRKRQVGQEDEN